MPAALVLAFVVVGSALLFRLGVTALVALAATTGAVPAYSVILTALILGLWGYYAFQFAMRREAGRRNCQSFAVFSALFGGIQLLSSWDGLDLSSLITLGTVTLSVASAAVLHLPAVKAEMRA